MDLFTGTGTTSRSLNPVLVVHLHQVVDVEATQVESLVVTHESIIGGYGRMHLLQCGRDGHCTYIMSILGKRERERVVVICG